MLSFARLLVLLMGVQIVRSQGDPDISGLTSGETPAPTGTPTSTGDTDSPSASPTGFGGVIFQCEIPDVLPNAFTETVLQGEASANLPALPTGVVCYSVLPNGSAAPTPFTTIGFGFNPAVTDEPVPTSSALTSSSSSGSNLKVVLPAVLGSVAVATLLVAALLWMRKRKSNRRHSQRAWINRPGGWVQGGGAFNADGDRKVEQAPQQIALKERQPSYV